MNYPILFIEDNPGDIRLTIDAIKEYKSSQLKKKKKISIDLSIFTDGLEASNFISSFLNLNAPNLPYLIILDLNLPNKDGMELLKEIRSNPIFTGIPVVVLSTSRAHRDIRLSYEYGANAYLSKPTNFDDFFQLINQMCLFWINCNCIVNRK